MAQLLGSHLWLKSVPVAMLGEWWSSSLCRGEPCPAREAPASHWRWAGSSTMLVHGFSLVPQELKEVGKEQLKVGAELPANVSKNRYPHVLPCKCSLLPPAPSWAVRWAHQAAWLLSWQE